jgi:hypothetical protein
MVNLSASNAYMAPKTHPLDDLLQQGILKGHGLDLALWYPWSVRPADDQLVGSSGATPTYLNWWTTSSSAYFGLWVIR